MTHVIILGVLLSNVSACSHGEHSTAVIQVVPPVYPVAAAEAGVHGWVDVEVDLAPDGSVLDAKVVCGRHPLIDSASLDAALAWRFAEPIQDAQSQCITFVFERGWPTANQGPLVESYLVHSHELHVVYHHGLPFVSNIERTDGKLPIRNCRVHHERMEIDTVGFSGIPITVEFIRRSALHPKTWGERNREAVERLFPNTNRSVPGGCVFIGYYDPVEAEVFYCPACRSADEAWLVENPPPTGPPRFIRIDPDEYEP